MFDLIDTHALKAFFGSIVYSLLGVAVFLGAFWGMNKLAPFSIHKEIEEDQNTALGIVIGSVLLGLSIIIASAIH